MNIPKQPIIRVTRNRPAGTIYPIVFDVHKIVRPSAQYRSELICGPRLHRDTRFLKTKRTLAGRSASLLMYQGNQNVP